MTQTKPLLLSTLLFLKLGGNSILLLGFFWCSTISEVHTRNYFVKKKTKKDKSRSMVCGWVCICVEIYFQVWRPWGNVACFFFF